MPYIKKEQREIIQEDGLLGIENAGDLNYYLTMTILRYFESHGGRYQQINDVLGALEGAKLEFTRRIVVPYEDKKIVENGDVY